MHQEVTVTKQDVERKCVLKLYEKMKECGMNPALAKEMSMKEFRSLAYQNDELGSSFRKAYRDRLQLLMMQRCQQHPAMEVTASGKDDRLEDETSTTRLSEHHGTEEEEMRAT